ncbi:unnamed protein product [Ilex paraguariensis]|uniref:Uncharacterized protein n=1 Tax=Ilex paraguariensis TaxID=185542 RepID=A0ABC8UCD8_9AQUA
MVFERLEVKRRRNREADSLGSQKQSVPVILELKEFSSGLEKELQAICVVASQVESGDCGGCGGGKVAEKGNLFGT